MIVTAEIKDDKWKASLDNLLVQVEEASRDASLYAAQVIQDKTKELLDAQHHGKYTDTPSQPGEPPASISGDLSASIQAEMITDDMAAVGPTAGYGRSEHYARIQELGGPMYGHPLMIWFREFRGHLERITAEFVELPARPYLDPATEWAVESGRVREIYAEFWAYAIRKATG